MRPLDENETTVVFNKLHKFVGGNLKNIVLENQSHEGPEPNPGRYCFRLQKNRVYYVSESLVKRATNIKRATNHGSIDRRRTIEKFRLIYLRRRRSAMERYQIVKEVGSGSYGRVFQAVNKDTKEVVAIKKLKQRYSSWETCLNMIEVKSLSQMNHPNVVKLMEVIKEYDDVFFVFEYMGYNVHHLLSARYPRGPLNENQVRNWSFQIFQGLEHVHQCGFFHRDLKPENLLVSSDFSTIKIADFGMARETDSGPPFTRHVTTQWYRAPEVLLGSNNYTSAVDMWAMGAIMMELITLRPLFPGSSPLHQLNMTANLIGSPTRVDWPEGIDLASASKYRFPDVDCGRLAELMPPGYSQHALNLIYLLLSWDPCVRPTASEVLRHPFFHKSWSSSAWTSGTCFERNCNHCPHPQSFAAAILRPPPGFA